MSVKWTENQQNAISARSGSVLVSAAAGSGKTAVLVQRVIDTITDKTNSISIDKMLIVTFTRAASAEMRTRVDLALNDMLRSDPYNSYLLRQKQLLYNAHISTIDGFCAEFVRQYFYKLNIQKDFKIADEKELSLLRGKALDNTLEQLYNSEDPKFMQLVSSVCSYRNDNNLRDIILEIYNFLLSIPFMNSWLDKALSIYDIDKTPVKTAPYIKNTLNNISESLDYAKSLIISAKELIHTDTYLEEKYIEKFNAMFKSDMEIVEKLSILAHSFNWDGLYEGLNLYAFCRFVSIRNGGDDPVKDAVKSIRDSYKSEIEKAKKLVFRTISEIEEETQTLYPIIEALFNSVKLYHKEFSKIKRGKNLADFSDIENWMIELLCEETPTGIVFTDIAGEISSMFDCIMVDEFQDINEVQNLIFKALSRNEENIFMVGDVKQSIYGFRQAKPEIFIDYKNKYSLYSKEEDAYPAKIILDKNFRSRKGILEACNFVFENIMSPDVGGIVYNDEEKLFCGASYPDTQSPQMEVDIVDISSLDKENNETPEIIEARHVGSKILKMMFEEKLTVFDKGEQRPAVFSDFAILLRTAKGMGKKSVTFVNELNLMGIPVVANEKNSFFDIYEIKIMLNLLRVIDNPLQDIPMLSVLFSPIFSFTPDELAEIRSQHRRTSIYNAILSDSKNNSKSAEFISFISRMRKISATTTVDKLIGMILELTGLDSVVMAVSNTTANLNLLQEYARTFSSDGYKNLSSFVRFVDRLAQKGLDFDAGASSETAIANAVQVMSIHGSKGLEFPICFICNTNSEFNTRDTVKNTVLDSTQGIGIRYKEDFLKFDTVQRKSAALSLENSFISEEMRILYVAMTRPKERMIITCTQKDPMGYISKINSKITNNIITPYAVKNCNSISDWIVACSLLHPSCKEWRQKIGSQIIPSAEIQTPWEFNILTDEDLEPLYSDEELTEESPDEKDPVNLELLEELKNRFEFQYKNQGLTALPQKVSASDLAHRDNDVFEKVLRTPDFISDKPAKGTDRGMAFHIFMEHCDFEKATENPQYQIDLLCSKGYLTQEQCALLEIDKITKLFRSQLFKRLLSSKNVYREYQFTVKITGDDFDENIDNTLKEQSIIMQGAVDLAFEEGEELVIVDYKTDRVKDLSSLTDLYSKQLRLYKTAMEQCTDYKVKELYIYSLHLNEFIML